MATVRWKDKSDVGEPADADRMPITDVDDTNTDKYVAAGKFARYGTAGTFTTPQGAGTSALTHNTGWDGTTKQHWTANVNGSAFTVANPTTATTGVYYTIFVTYTTSHSVSWGANFKGVSGITPTATAGSYDHFTFRFDGTNMQCVGHALDTGA